MRSATSTAQLDTPAAGHNLGGMDSTLACLAAWMPRQRWYAAKGRPPSLRLVAWWDPPPGRERRHGGRAFGTAGAHLPRRRRGRAARRAVPDPRRLAGDGDGGCVRRDHIIGSPEPGTTFIDGPFDPAYARALLALVTRRRARARAAHRRDRPPDATACRRTGPRTAAVLTGEQSNTSLIYRSDDGSMPIICKVFRQLHPGLNPDIELQTALADAGSPHVPPAIGSVEGAWPDLATAQGTVTGSLAFAQEFLPGVEDAWRVALQRRRPRRGLPRPRARARRRDRRRARLARRALPDAGDAAAPTARPRRRPGGAGWRSRSPRCRRSPSGARRSKRSTPARSRSRGRRCSASTATTTSARCSRCPSADGCCSTSRASRCGRWPSAARLDLPLRDVAGHAAVVRLRRRAPSASTTPTDPRKRSASGRAPRAARSSRGTPSASGADLDVGERSAGRARARQGRVRGDLRVAQPADLGVDPAARDRAARRAARRAWPESAGAGGQSSSSASSDSVVVVVLVDGSRVPRVPRSP